MKSTVLVFGGSGFIGTHLIRKLVSDNEFDVISLDLKPPREALEGVEYRIVDVRNLENLYFSRKACRIYNLAAVHATPGHFDCEYYETNIVGALEVVRLAENMEINDIVFTSSISVYGPGDETRTEASPLAPTSAYGFSKMFAEKIHFQWAVRQVGRKLTIVRPAVVFGFGEGGNFTRLAAMLRRGIFVYPGRKDTIKACIFVDDLIEAINFAHRNSAGCVLFNASYPGRYTLEDIVNGLIAEHFVQAKTFMIPASAVRIAAKILRSVNFLDIGIHPDRVDKLIKSTDVHPSWLVEHGFAFPPSLAGVLDRWSKQTNGSFV